MSRLAWRAAGLALAAMELASCGAIRSGAVKSVATMLSETGTTVSSHDDPELVADALPFALLLNESILASVPRHEGLLTATCSQYTQYAVGFIQADAEAAQFDDYPRSQSLSGRALKLALRGRGYCWRALEIRFPGVPARLAADPAASVPQAKRAHVPLLYWSAASLGSAVSAGGLDHPELLIHWPVIRALAERALALDEAWGNGALHELLITVESQGEALGGSEARARAHFARAVEIQKGRSPGPYLSLALGIAKGKNDRAEFEALLRQALAIDPDASPETRLATLLAQQRARLLLAHLDDLFLEPDAGPRPAALSVPLDPSSARLAYALLEAAGSHKARRADGPRERK
ncbi:MAG TPA: TRAP transporter TatT component family protein [Vicinamibacterales bacterium]|nr:TRAP transporter TatT component family protein [Vicinamibacterales bacterium]HPW21191.1 TRAP transporter TatT component family protein [Vicinamibacterales bacterium]